MSTTQLPGIIDYPLKSGNWFEGPQTKKYVLWHCTQGRSSATPVNGKPGEATSSIDGWNDAEKHIGTPYLIDREGTIYRTFKDDSQWIFHLGLKGTNGLYDKASVGIEMANELELQRSGGDYYAFDTVGRNNRYVGDVFERDWREHHYWARLSEPQIDSMIRLTLDICERYKIEPLFYYPSTKFDYPRCFKVAAILCHSNCRKDKTDMILEDWIWDKIRAAGIKLVAEAERVQTKTTETNRPKPTSTTIAREGHGVPAVATPVLKSDLLKGDNTLEAVADGRLILEATGGRVEGIGPVQDALNRLGFTIDLGRSGQFRGFFGEITKAAVKAFQTSANIGVDGRVGTDTINKLDDALLSAGVGGLMPGAPAGQPKASRAAAKKPAAGAPMPDGKFVKTLVKVLNRGIPSPEFLQELVAWGKTASNEIFVDKQTEEKDVYASVKPKLGPYGDLIHRKACMLEVMRVLAGFESSWKWNTGRDTTNPDENSPDTISAGPFQVSANSLGFGQDLKDLVAPHGIRNAKRDGDAFQALMKTNHTVAFNYISRLLRHTIRHNGPVKRSEINKWLSRDAVAEFQGFLA
ncbi:MAG TPA: peptidoglycan-binding domain-containing protein [Chthoniobacterales bacterium]|nr:peptidoglycan-binding domain-containing protein [Chthoniobacterales bacterium]